MLQFKYMLAMDCPLDLRSRYVFGQVHAREVPQIPGAARRDEGGRGRSAV